jgi:hypothetical protein
MFQAKKCSNAAPVLEFKDDFVGRTDPGLDPGDLRRMRNVESHPAGFALLSPPYELP